MTKTWIYRLIIVVMVMVFVLPSALLFLGRMLLNTDWGRHQVLGQLIQLVDEETGAKLQVGDIQGDLLYGVQVHALQLSKRDTLLSVDTLHLRYSWKELLQKRIHIDDIYMAGMDVHLVQDSLGRFNVEEYLPKVIDEEETGSTALSDWNVRIGSVRVRSSEVQLSRSGFPGLRAEFELDAGQRKDSLGIEWLHLKTDYISADPWFADASMPKLHWQSFDAQLNGWIPLHSPKQAQVTIESQLRGLHYDTIESTHLETRISYEGLNDGTANVEHLKLEVQEATVEAQGRFSKVLEQHPEYTLSIALRDLNLAHFEGYQSLQTDINLDLSVDGKGFDHRHRSLSARLEVLPSELNATPLNKLVADLKLHGDTLEVDGAALESDILDARFDGDLHIGDLFYPSNHLSFTLDLKDLQPLAAFVGYDRLQAQGNVRGRLIQGERAPELHTVLDLHQLVLDTMEADSLGGEYAMELNQDARYGAQIGLTGLRLDGFELEGVQLESEGFVSEERMNGELFLNLNAGDTLFSSLEGAFKADKNHFQMDTKALQLSGFFGSIDLQSPFRFQYQDDILRTDALQLQSDRGDQLELTIEHLDTERAHVRMQTNGIQLANVLEHLPDVPDVAGILKGHLSVDFSKGDVLVESDLMLLDAQYDSLIVDTLGIHSRIMDKRWEGKLQAIHESQSLLQATWNVPFQWGDPNTFDDAFFEEPVDGRFLIDSLRLAPLLELTNRLGLPQTDGILQLEGVLEGTAGSPLFKGSMELLQAAIAGVPVELFSLKWVYDQDRKVLETNASLQATGQHVGTARVAIPMNIDLRNFRAIIPAASDRIEGEAIAEGFNLALLNPLLPGSTIEGLQGTIHGGISMQGTIGDPSFAGFLALDNGSIAIPEYNLNLRSILAELRFDDDRLHLDRGSMQSGDGQLKIDGSLLLNAFTPSELELSLNAKQFTIADTRDIKVALSGQSTIKGQVSRPVMTGSILIDRMNIYLDDFGERTVEEVIIAETTDFDPGSYYDSLAIQVRVQISPNSWIRNRNSPELALELEGDLDLVKRVNRDMQAFGSLNTRQGYAIQYGKRFKMEKGSLSFSGNPENPTLDIVTLYELRVPEDIQIRYEIGGTLEKPSFTFSSVPEMELENIISYTLFGKPFGALFSWQQTFSGGGGGSALARDAAIGVLVDRIENLATGRLGIDLLQIDTNRLGESVSTSIKAGKYITDKLFLQVTNELGGSDAVTRVVLEYFVRRNLLLVLTQGNDRRSGVDLLWKYEY
jgi:autotransporter translocation and assembly factor TamB